MAKKLNKVQGWGIAHLASDGSVQLVFASSGRQAVRDQKRDVYPGSEYKTVKINATLETYTK